MHMLYVTVHVQLRASGHITCLCLHQWRLSGKEGILNLPFRQCGRVQPLPCLAANVLPFLSKSG